eukprot:TRINITY_DN49770_c0_g1_i2.p1 TRINITY_DN49770_c0_g1~~TRINITY_DN49770_c0_g1_i2.p1  ORF type:complete len:318 (-),score=47.63 TRINITY_DN49770_c0_g1_i2:109-1062(-)
MCIRDRFSVLRNTLDNRNAVLDGNGRSRWLVGLKQKPVDYQSSMPLNIVADEHVAVYIELCERKEHSAIAPTTSSISLAGPVLLHRQANMRRPEVHIAVCTRCSLLNPLYAHSAVAPLEHRLAAAYRAPPITSVCVLASRDTPPPRSCCLWRTWGGADADLGWGKTSLYLCFGTDRDRPPITELVVGCTISESLDEYEMITSTPSGASADLDNRSLFVGVSRDPAHGPALVDVTVLKTCGFVAFGSKESMNDECRSLDYEIVRFTPSGQYSANVNQKGRDAMFLGFRRTPNTHLPSGDMPEPSTPPERMLRLSSAPS